MTLLPFRNTVNKYTSVLCTASFFLHEGNVKVSARSFIQHTDSREGSCYICSDDFSMTSMLIVTSEAASYTASDGAG